MLYGFFEGRAMVWTETNGEHHAEGQYWRVYVIVAEGTRWRAWAGRKSRVFTEQEDAKLWCEAEEDDAKRG